MVAAVLLHDLSNFADVLQHDILLLAGHDAAAVAERIWPRNQ